jgi:hypothetical protein
VVPEDLGTISEQGSSLVGPAPTAIATLKVQDRDLFRCFAEAQRAQAADQVPPPRLPAGARPSWSSLQVMHTGPMLGMVDRRLWTAVLGALALATTVGACAYLMQGDPDGSPASPATQGKDIYRRPLVVTATNRYDPEYIGGENIIITSTVHYSDSTRYVIEKPGESEWRTWEVTLKEVTDDVVDWYEEDFPRPRYLVYRGPPSADVLCWMHTPMDWFVDLSMIDALRAAGQISVTPGADLFGRPVAIAEKDNAVHGNPLQSTKRCRVTYDRDSGFRFRIETFGDSPKWSDYTVQGIQFDWPVDQDQMKTPVNGEILNSYYTLLAGKNPDHEFEFPAESHGVLSPTSTAYSYGYTAGPLGYIEDQIRNSPGSFWSVIQQLLAPGWKEIDVVQGLDGAETERNVAFYWPDDAWKDGAPPQSVGSRTARLATGQDVTIHELDTTVNMDARYVATWAYPPGLRILFVANENVTADEFLAVMDEYMQRSSPLTWPPTPRWPPISSP